jgi:hypothetical protein
LKVKKRKFPIKQTLQEKKVYSTYEIDDLILGPLEDLGSLEAEPAQLLTFDLIYDFFSWHICRFGRMSTSTAMLRRQEQNGLAPGTYIPISNLWQNAALSGKRRGPAGT